MKADIRLATKQFCYVEFHVEADSAEEILKAEKQIHDAYRMVNEEEKSGSGLSPKDFNRVLDNYLYGTKSMSSDEYYSMDQAQQRVIQEIKKCRKRNKVVDDEEYPEDQINPLDIKL